MRKSSLIMIMALIISLFSTIAFAGPVIKHEKIVAADGSGDFTTITAALNAITDASDTNRYRITIKPGTYNESPMGKDYIDIIGSGKNNTIIRGGGNPYYIFQVRNYSLSHLTAENTSGNATINLLGNSMIDHVKIIGGIGIVHENSNMPNCIISNSEIIASSWGMRTLGPHVVIVNTSINSADIGIQSYCANCDTIIKNSDIIAGNIALQLLETNWQYNQKVHVYNSVLSGTDAIQIGYDPIYNDRHVYVSGSKLIGNFDTLQGRDKLINCYDGDFNSIPNL